MKEHRNSRTAKGKLLALALASAAVSCGAGICPANAALLHGYINNENLSEANPGSVLMSGVAQAQTARNDSFPAEVQGAWSCVTLVIDSFVDSVPVGQKLLSQTNFVRSNDGRILARNLQAGWTASQETVTAFSSTQYQMERTNYFTGDSTSGAWAARSRDRFLLVEKNRMIAESEVDQYINGQFVGRYKTRSTLFRQGTGMENVASHPIPDPDDYSKSDPAGR